MLTGVIDKMCEFCDRIPEQPGKIDRSHLMRSLGEVNSYMSTASIKVSYVIKSPSYDSIGAQNA